MVWEGVLEGTDVSRPGAFEWIGDHAPPADRKLVADVSSSAGRGCRAPLSAAEGAHGGNLKPVQASRVESGDRGRSIDARAGGCVEQCSESGGQRRRFVAPERRV